MRAFSELQFQLFAGGSAGPPARTLPHAITATLKTGPHRALIIRAPGVGLIRRYSPARLRGIVSGLLVRPLVALVLVAGLLVLCLAVLRVDEQIITLRRLRGAGGRIGRRLGHHIAVLDFLPVLVGGGCGGVRAPP